MTNNKVDGQNSNGSEYTVGNPENQVRDKSSWKKSIYTAKN